MKDLRIFIIIICLLVGGITAAFSQSDMDKDCTDFSKITVHEDGKRMTLKEVKLRIDYAYKKGYFPERYTIAEIELFYTCKSMTAYPVKMARIFGGWFDTSKGKFEKINYIDQDFGE